MGIRKSTERYEAWLAERVTLVAADVEVKHARMREAVFPFMRATFYRWAETMTAVCGDDLGGPRVLAVGDLHLENFGTWRDAEGRLIWGINDFDEACPLPATADLIRLATSARLAAAEGRLALDSKSSAEALLDGYQEALEARGLPFVLAEAHGKLRNMALKSLRDPAEFWAKLDRVPPCEDDPPKAASDLLHDALPRGATVQVIGHRVAGLGSLGRPRFVARCEWNGGRIARETKPLAPSACVWAGLCAETEHVYPSLLERAVRCPDPTVHALGGWIVRRLAPDCTKIDVGALPRERDEAVLLTAMGFETANVHLGSSAGPQLAADIAARPKGWLARAAERMAHQVHDDWEAFKKA